jgi:predicted MFS family arabinose efflux permease
VKQENITSVNSLFSGYGAVLRNKSALGCIIGTVLGLTTWNIYLIYGASYWRQVFAIQVTTIALAMIFTSLSYTAGSLLTGKVTKRIGIRRTLLFTTGILGGITLFAFNAQSFIISIALASVASFLAGSMITSSSSFSLGQVPEYSGTMMSLHSVAVSLGGTLSALFGGVFLLSFGYGGYAVILGVVGLVAALVFQFLTVEPVRLRA